MNVEITGRHVIITPAIRSYIMKRLRKFSNILGEDASFHAILDVEKERQTAEIVIKSKLLNVTGKGQTDDMYSSILRALEKIERQALKQKNRVIEVKRRRAKEDSVAQKTGIDMRAAPSSEPRRNGIREEEAHRKPMAVEEAVLELNQTDYSFVVFRNIDSGAVNVLYRRKDGSLGLINA